MHPVALLFGLGCAVAVWFAAQSGRAGVVITALLLAALWAIANVLWQYNALEWLPLIDFVIAISVLGPAIEGETWATRLVALFYMRLGSHLFDMATDHAYLVIYIHMINALFALALWSVAEPGGKDGLDLLRRFFSRHLRRPVFSARGA